MGAWTIQEGAYPPIAQITVAVGIVEGCEAGVPEPIGPAGCKILHANFGNAHF
jgi:hypothetical protein